MTDGPLIVQSDKSLLLEVDHPRADDARRAIAPFAELERAPEHVHTYRLTPLGLWNARAAGHDAEQVVNTLIEYSRYPVPHALLIDVVGQLEHVALGGPLRQLHPGDRPVPAVDGPTHLHEQEPPLAFGPQLLDRALGHDAAVVDQHDGIAEPLDEVELVAREHDGHAVVRRLTPEHAGEHVDADRVETREGLVEHE